MQINRTKKTDVIKRMTEKKYFSHNNTISTGIVELKFPKHGCPRSKNTTRGELNDSGPLREQQHTRTARIGMHQSQLLKTNQSQRSSSVLYKVTPNQSILSPDED